MSLTLLATYILTKIAYFRGNYSFLNLALCAVTFGVQKLFKGGNYSRAETICRNTVVLKQLDIVVTEKSRAVYHSILETFGQRLHSTLRSLLNEQLG